MVAVGRCLRELNDAECLIWILALADFIKRLRGYGVKRVIKDEMVRQFSFGL